MNNENLKIFIFFVILLQLIGLSFTSSICIANDDEPTPPNQPPTGPGGSDYFHDNVIKMRYKWGVFQYWIFEPDNPKPESAPLIIFNHGGGAIHPIVYKEWIYHIVKKGNILVYPRFQLGLLGRFHSITDYAIQAVKDAIIELQSGGHVLPLLDKFAIVGHSLGGGITAYMAAISKDFGLPVPKAIMPVQPFFPIKKSSDLSLIDNETLMLVIAGEDDRILGSQFAKMIFYNATQIPLSQKDFIIQRTDTYGEPDLVANHIAPSCSYFFNTVNAMDYYSTWKLFDGLIDYAFYGINKEYCLGNTSEQRFMGLWSDGTPVKELLVTNNP